VGHRLWVNDIWARRGDPVAYRLVIVKIGQWLSDRIMKLDALFWFFWPASATSIYIYYSNQKPLQQWLWYIYIYIYTQVDLVSVIYPCARGLQRQRHMVGRLERTSILLFGQYVKYRQRNVGRDSATLALMTCDAVHDVWRGWLVRPLTCDAVACDAAVTCDIADFWR